MRIENLRQEQRGDCRRIAADLLWEDSERPGRTLYFQTCPPFATELALSPDAFLLAALPLAVSHGERRIRVEGSVCPRLREGLESAMAIFAMWYAHCRPLAIEPTNGFVPALPRPDAGTASFMSGGVDALALLRANRLDYPLDHPGSIRTCLMVFGLNTHDFAGAEVRAERLAAFEAHSERMQQLAERVNFTLIPIHTNTRTLYDDFRSWADVGFAAGIICTALTLPERIGSAWLASGGVGVGRRPCGTHPLLDHHYSTAAVEVHHGQAALSRLEKTRLVAEWEEARPLLRSCLYHDIPPAGRINCESCEKCVRTMLALIALGRLQQVSAFASDDVTAGMLEVVRIETALDLAYYSECIEPLKQRNRHDLARPLEEAIAAYVQRTSGGWMGRLRGRLPGGLLRRPR
ncbi:hypothetical protein BH23GEM9_BH23GEM9_29170 [soil metagenome]